MHEIARSGATAAPATASAARSTYVYDVVRRVADVIAAAILLVLLSPVLVLISLAILIDSGLPVLYRSQRLGRGGEKIIVLKFRSMRDGSFHHLVELLTADEERRLEYDNKRKLRDDPRRTRVGAILRKTSLDELPQLWNVLRGDMSLIGPRPYFADELQGRPEALEILSVRPGITGLWQVNGRSERTFEERLSLERRYVRRRGLRLDLKILLRTVIAVVTARGAY